MQRINLIADARGGAGLARDLELLAEVLTGAGYRVTVTPIAPPKDSLLDRLRNRRQQLSRAIRRNLPGARFDANIMLEKIYPRLLAVGRRTLFVPNPEWYVEGLAPRLEACELVLAKTRHAEEAFAGLGRPVAFVGFTSADRRRPQAERQPGFVHIPGKSYLKGTLPLIQLWAENPQWPRLTVVYRQVAAAALPLLPNVTFVTERLGEAALLDLQNTQAFHLCPSATEGYGHYIGEAMSVGAVTVTLDAPPMNELVRPDRGVLVPAQPVGWQNLATLYGYRPRDLRAAVERCIAMPVGERQRLGDNARHWFEQNRADFSRRLVAALRAALAT